MKRLAEWIVRKRFFVLIGMTLVTLLFGVASLRIDMYTAFSDLLPTKHPFISVHNKFSKVFGGANLVLLSVEVKDGDIFNTKTLEKIKKLTEVLELTQGASNYQIFSIARQKVKDVRATSWGIEVQPIMWPDVPRGSEALEQLRNAVYANPTVAGRLVSMDGKAALITAAFHEERLDYAQLFRRVRSAAREAEDANTKVYAAGEPILYGWIYYHLRDILLLIGLTSLTLLGLLMLYY
ncbi:MAG: MMPL family transporter, partial [Deltaproteobacteria bacterium]|nr:MMPL family transporter [Deltaproteobacteria bacterium]